MPDVMKTVLLNPPSFENFDGGAGSRWPATREIESYWYPVWLTYPAGGCLAAWDQLAADRRNLQRLRIPGPVYFHGRVCERYQASAQNQGRQSLPQGGVCRTSRPYQAGRNAECRRRH